VEQFLRVNEQTTHVARPSLPVYRYDTNSVASNFPNEDDYCSGIVSLELPGSSRAGATSISDLAFFGVFDGHAGWQLSRYLAANLLREITQDIVHSLDPNSSVRTLTRIPPDTIPDVIKKTFLRLDEEIVNGPLPYLEEFRAKGSPDRAHRHLPIEIHARNANAVLQANAGSCALLACMDPANNQLHVAVTGDSRAVMGTWNPSLRDGKGSWKTAVLSEDQTGFNPAEVKRMQSEHPPEEADKLCMNGRALGKLGVTRAFGNARLKWPGETITEVYKMIGWGIVNPFPHYDTPPYVTVRPEVTTVPLNDFSKSGSSPNEPQRRFLVLASDGVFDTLTNDEVVGLVGGWLDGCKGIYTRKEVLSKVDSADPSTPAYQPQCTHDPNSGMDFVFVDENIATHVIRNALGGKEESKMQALLSLPTNHSRRHRDDMTVTVILWEARKPSTDNTVKSKL
jgi:pyruvate dehydrogenase phosphatase